MNVESIKNAFSVAYESTKEAVFWLGRKISLGWTNYAMPFFKATGTWLTTGYGAACAGITAGTIFLTVAMCLDSSNVIARTICATAAVLCFIGAGAALTVGTAALI